MKKLFSMILTIAILLSLTAGSCMATASENLYPRTITDHAGREVVIEEQPESLISTYYITTSLLIALDLDDELAGIEEKANQRPLYARSIPELLELPWVGTAKAVDLEVCAAVAPDLAILPMKAKDYADQLEALGISVILVNPESQELLFEMIDMVSTATGTEEKAAELTAFIGNLEAQLTEAMNEVDRPSVYLCGNSSFLSTAGSAMYQSDMIRLAGGVNVAAAIEDTYWAEIDYEQLLAWNPEYIILPSSAKYTVEDIMADPNLSACTAVVNKNVYQFPNDAEAWDSPVPSSILGALWLANILHPEQLSAETCAAAMNEYYETFYNFTYAEN